MSFNDILYFFKLYKNIYYKEVHMIEKEILSNRETNDLPIQYKIYEIFLAINESAYNEKTIDYNTFVNIQEILINLMKKIYIK